jgi:myo-inositol-1(or 4)-monophosphatase
MNLQNLCNHAVDAAKKAGNFLIKNKDQEKLIFGESGRDIKLELDRSTEQIIYQSLKETNIDFFGEEFGGSNTGIRWVVDPIDGTANYFRGLDQCCISIALMDKDDVSIGVIYNFNNDEMYSAIKGKGAFLNDKKIRVSKVKEKSKASLTTGFPASESFESSLDFLKDLKEWKKIRMFGSAALSCAYIASGKCDFYSEKGVYLWDIAAGICLVREAGGLANFRLIDNDRYEVAFSNNLL